MLDIGTASSQPPRYGFILGGGLPGGAAPTKAFAGANAGDNYLSQLRPNSGGSSGAWWSSNQGIGGGGFVDRARQGVTNFMQGGGPAPAPDPMIAWLQAQANQRNQMINQQIGSLAGQANQSRAFTDSQARYAQQQAGFNNQLNQNSMQSLGIGMQGTTAQYNFQNALADLQARIGNQQLESAGNSFSELQRHAEALKKLSSQGLGNTMEYLSKSDQLNKEIYNQALKWLGEQGGYNERDLQLTTQALKNVLSTATEAFSEAGTRQTNQTQLAGQERGLGKEQAAFQAGVQGRAAQSDAISRGAMGSEGYSQTRSDIKQQKTLTDKQTQLQFDSQMESIRAAYQQGLISYNDAQRQATDAQARARYNYDTTAGSLANQRQGAEFNWRDYQAGSQRASKEAQLGHKSTSEQIQNQLNQGYQQYVDANNQYNAGVDKWNAESQYRTEQYNLAIDQYEADVNRYNILKKQNTAQAKQQAQQLYYELTQRLSQLEQQRAALEAGRW